MPHINEQQVNRIRHYINWFHKQVIHGLSGIIADEVRHFSSPSEIAEVEDQADRLLETFERKNAFHNTVELPDDLIPIFKRMMIDVRHSEVAQIESYKERTHNPELLETLDERLKPINELMEQTWLKEARPTRIPLLTEYISLQRVEEIKGSHATLEERIFDQKFHILQAPGLIIDDLKYYRDKCEMRGTAVVVAFIDIDDFKKNFNERYGEIAVDRRVLPVLMAKLEAHVFNHGYAYRHGGDEFVLILPNMTFDMAVVFLDIIRRDIADLRYPGIEGGATISIGFVYIDSNCFLTNREVVEKANKAKKFAKGEDENKGEGKNRIATFGGLQFDEKELYIVNPQYPSSHN
jgi:diguanylate cyclase (GGDEF)-like protein